MTETTVAAIISKPDSTGRQILLALRGHEPFEDRWCFPGGHIDPGETPQQAIVREVKEETNLDLAPKLLDGFDEVIPDMGIDAFVLVFEGTWQGTPTPRPGEVKELRWFCPCEAARLPLAFLHNEILDAYISTLETA